MIVPTSTYIGIHLVQLSPISSSASSLNRPISIFHEGFRHPSFKILSILIKKKVMMLRILRMRLFLCRIYKSQRNISWLNFISIFTNSWYYQRPYKESIFPSNRCGTLTIMLQSSQIIDYYKCLSNSRIHFLPPSVLACF